jgi:aryl-alcohol dehydrogenase-like predicted oxidoreductase
MQYRELGRTGRRLSVIGFGGILVVGEAQAEADRLVESAVERGITYFDVAPSYGDGEAEQKLGPALEPFRKDVFLACKTMRRDAAGAREELERSLRRMRTDHFDLYQLHAVTTLEDVEQALGPGGALEAIVEARGQGKVNFIGFSAHAADAATELLRRFAFDSVLYPFNFAVYMSGTFVQDLIDTAMGRGAGLLGLKAMALTNLPAGTKREERPWHKCWYQPIEDEELAALALRFTLSLPVTAAIPPGDTRLWERAYRAVQDLQPLSVAERTRLEEAARQTKPLRAPIGTSLAGVGAD